MERNYYDLTHYSATVGKIGRLQTLSCVPVVAGDSMEVNMTAAARLSPLRRQLSLDSKVDVMTFFVPHRHVYGDAWKTLMTEGMAGSTSLPAVTCFANDGFTPYVGTSVGPNLPLHMPAGYAKIWNQYFRIPNVSTQPTDFMDETDFPTDVNVLAYGKECARLPAEFSGGIDYNGNPDDQEVSAVGDQVNLVDIQQAKALYKTNEEREWFEHRYRDVMKGTFGASNVNTDADERPTLCWHTSEWMSGYDVDCTGDQSFGAYRGKSSMMINHSMPSRYFKEHGMLWTMAVVRFPTIVQNQMHRFNSSATVAGNLDLTYETIAGDPMVYASKRPIDYNFTDYFGAGSGYSGFEAGTQPYGQWYRSHPSYVHVEYNLVQGFPFIKPDVLGSQDLHGLAYDTGVYDMFENSSLKDWNIIAKVGIDAKRVIPPATSSIFTGAK